VAFVSSAYSGGADEVIRDFGCSEEVYTLGLSLFVLGFALGPVRSGDVCFHRLHCLLMYALLKLL